MPSPDFAVLIDGLLAARKTIAGTPTWEPGPRRQGQMRWKAPLDIDGELCGLDLVADAYTREPTLKFTIVIAHRDARTGVVRVEHSVDASHMNNPPVPQGVPEYLITGPHCHGWQDNRRFFTPRPPPPDSPSFARLLPANIQGFANSFRWLCGEYAIDCGRHTPDYPRSDTLV